MRKCVYTRIIMYRSVTIPASSVVILYVSLPLENSYCEGVAGALLYKLGLSYTTFEASFMA